MESELLGIGRLASLSGLSISALRFYDAADVLVPASVDPASGYRRYRPDQVRAARLIAQLRRAGLPVSEIRAAVRAPQVAGPILDRHLAQLEIQLDDARRQLSIARSLLTMEDRPMLTLHVPAAELRAGLLDVRFAVSTDPELPMLGGVLFDVAGDRLRLVATDRYRLALASLSIAEQAEPAELLLPVNLVDQLIAVLAGQDGEVALTREAGELRFTCAGKVIAGRELALDFPRYRTILARAGAGVEVPVDVAALRAALADAPTQTRVRESDGVSYPLVVLDVAPDGIRIAEDGAVGVNREFLLQALDAGEQLTLQLDEPTGPLTFRQPGPDGGLSILMPVRLD